MSTGQLTKKILIEGTITAKTGLHIGGTNIGLSIGGADATVIRNPLTNQPYIPGSSLKGKMRSLLEKLEGKFGGPIDKNVRVGPNTNIEDPNTLIPKIFGTMPEKMKSAQPTSRIIVRDCPLTDNSQKELLGSANTDMPYTEVKTEVVIDRITSAATPRQLERVPAGAEFKMAILLNVFSDEGAAAEANHIKKILQGLSLVQNDYLGGKGTRGSGEVKIQVTHLMFKDKGHYESGTRWEKYSAVPIPDELQ